MTTETLKNIASGFGSFKRGEIINAFREAGATVKVSPHDAMNVMITLPNAQKLGITLPREIDLHSSHNALTQAARSLTQQLTIE